MVRFDRPATFPLRAQGVTLPGTPLVSVVMTCFNSAAWLDESISSVLSQSWRHLELVVVDDGSTDDTRHVLANLARHDARIRTFRLVKNHGTYPAKNIGMSISHGSVITFMDSDDTAAKDRIERQLEALRPPDIVATTCNYMRLDATGQPLKLGGVWERQALISLMVKREVIADLGWFDTVRTSADDEFFERIRHVYGRASHHNVPAALYLARQREGSLTSSGRALIRLDAGDVNSMLSEPRQAYVDSYRHWYGSLSAIGRRPYIPFNIYQPRPFPVREEVALK